jgi:hypothetical protein
VEALAIVFVVTVITQGLILPLYWRRLCDLSGPCFQIELSYSRQFLDLADDGARGDPISAAAEQGPTASRPIPRLVSENGPEARATCAGLPLMKDGSGA